MQKKNVTAAARHMPTQRLVGERDERWRD